MSSPGCDPDTSNANGTPAPSVHASRCAATSSVVGSSTSKPRLGDDRTSVGVDLEDQHLAAGLAGDHRDEQPDRPPADHEDLLARRELGAADVVDGDCRGFHERCVPQRDLVRQPDEDA